jgi:hypothetical protein
MIAGNEPGNGPLMFLAEVRIGLYHDHLGNPVLQGKSLHDRIHPCIICLQEGGPFRKRWMKSRNLPGTRTVSVEKKDKCGQDIDLQQVILHTLLKASHFISACGCLCCKVKRITATRKLNYQHRRA